MKLGVCTSIDNSRSFKAAGWEYIEESAQGLLEGLSPDSQWTRAEYARVSALPVLAANALVPASLPIVGPAADRGALRGYMTAVTRRAAACGIQTLVFGSGRARQVPVGFDREQAWGQIAEFAHDSATAAAEQGVTIVVEPLNRGECNILNTVAEAMELVREVAHPSFRCLVDSYHLWLENEPVGSIVDAGPAIRHVHLADVRGRMPPGESGEADYRPLFAALKRIGYDGLISVESSPFADTEIAPRRVLDFLRREWDAA